MVLISSNKVPETSLHNPQIILMSPLPFPLLASAFGAIEVEDLFSVVVSERVAAVEFFGTAFELRFVVNGVNRHTVVDPCHQI